MADGRVYASSEVVSVEQREFSSEQDIPDPTTYVSFLKTDELKAEPIKRGLKRSGNKSVLIDRLRAAIQSQDHCEEPIESITPIYKSGDKSDPTNYRGICVSSCLGKLFCQIVQSGYVFLMMS